MTFDFHERSLRVSLTLLVLVGLACIAGAVGGAVTAGIGRGCIMNFDGRRPYFARGRVRAGPRDRHAMAGASARSAATIFCSTWSGLVAPAITLATKGCATSQENGTSDSVYTCFILLFVDLFHARLHLLCSSL